MYPAVVVYNPLYTSVSSSELILTFKSRSEERRVRKEQLGYRHQDMSQRLKAIKQYFTQDKFIPNSSLEHTSNEPIFIVGLPRSGSTLLEQILSSHSMVDDTFELNNVASIIHGITSSRARHRQSGYPEALDDLPPQTLKDMGDRFLHETLSYRKGAPFFIDKMPNNFRHIGFIHLILPNAKIIDARRLPMACCFSGFKQLFGSGQEFTYGLEEIGSYYKDYVDLMDHWHQVLPDKILQVNYENVVEDLDTQVRRILTFCGLPFEQQCIDFHHSKRAIRTPSAEQVRQPIYQSGLEQWKHFEQFLDPLKNVVSSIDNTK